ncbi:MAG: hypothetical protein EBY48_04985 [Opitutae bacterium]|nr:hypothetical protein [Opitutae bacterium]
MKRIIFSIWSDLTSNHISAPDWKQESFRKFKHKLVDKQKEYAKYCDAEYFLFETKSTDYVDVQFDKILKFEKLTKQYDQVVYFDLDIIPITKKNIFEEFNFDYPCVYDQDVNKNALDEEWKKWLRHQYREKNIIDPMSRYSKVAAKKSVKVSGMNTKKTTVKVREKSLVSKIFATFAVFFVTALIVSGSTLGAYLVAPSQIGPIVRKFGIPIEQWFPGREADSVEIVQAPPGTLQDVKLAPEQWHHLRSSGITLMPIEGADGLQVISPVDPKLAMNDDDLRILQYIAQHLVILDLTNSQVSDEGLAVLQKFPNLKKLILEGSEKITIQGIQNISTIPSIELLNLIRLKLDDSAVDILSKMGGLQQVFLYQTGLSSDAIQKLKDARPRMFVNAG